MRLRQGHIGSLVLVILLTMTPPVAAQMTLGWTAGFDFTSHGYEGSVLEEVLTPGAAPSFKTTAFESSKSMSNHFVDMTLSGPVVSEHFASFDLRGSLTGTFFQSSTESSSSSEYRSPRLDRYYGSIMFFPDRPYPLKFFRARKLENILDYEPQNRAETNALEPGLSVVRRYRKDFVMTGGQFRYVASDKLSFLAQASDGGSESFRQYDFEENRDIWVEISVLRINELQEVDTVQVINDLPDASIEIVVGNIDTTLGPGEFAHLALDSGLQVVYVIPLQKYNQLQFTTRVIGESTWKIVYNEPPSPRDQESTERAGRIQMDVGGSGANTITAFYDVSERFDPASGQTSIRTQASNTAEYAFGSNDRIKMRTTYNTNSSEVESITVQENKIFGNETTFGHLPRRGLQATVRHELSHSENIAGGLKVTSNLNRFRSRLSLPFRKLSYRIELENDVSLKGDNSGLTTNQFGGRLTNQLETRLFGFSWQPRNTLDFTRRARTRADGTKNTTDILDATFDLNGKTVRTGPLGDVSLKGTYGYRKQSDEAGSDIREIMGFDILVTRQWTDWLQSNALTVQKWETSAGSTPQAGTNEDMTSSARPKDHKATYRADLRIMPNDEVSVGLGYSHVSEKVSTIVQYGFSLAAPIPYIRTPLTSSYSKSLRDIGSLPRQTVTLLKSEIKYRWRQIEFTLEHVYEHEKLVISTFKHHEVMARVTRRFGG